MSPPPLARPFAPAKRCPQSANPSAQTTNSPAFRPNIIHQTIPQQSKLAIDTIYRPLVKPDTEIYSPYGAAEWKLPEKLHRTKPLGKELCILDLDSRPLDGEGQIFGPLPLHADIAKKISGPSLGTLQHWLYGALASPASPSVPHPY